MGCLMKNDCGVDWLRYGREDTKKRQNRYRGDIGLKVEIIGISFRPLDGLFLVWWMYVSVSLTFWREREYRVSKEWLRNIHIRNYVVLLMWINEL